MKSFNNKVAAISGAGSGIGKALALRLAELGASIAINDINPDSLANTQAALKSNGTDVFSSVVDTSIREEVYAFAENVIEHFGRVDIVINNAGVALGKVTVDSVTYEDFEWIMGINFWGMVYGTKAFLPHLKKQKEGSIVNLSSMLGLVAVPYQAPYVTTKFAIRGFTETLRMELLLEAPHVVATTVHPGGIKTNIAASSKLPDTVDPKVHKEESIHFEKFFRNTAAMAANVILKGIRKKKTRVLIGNDAKLPDFLSRLFPQWHSKIIAGFMRRMIVKYGIDPPKNS
ncbi:MAG: SDR family oxidoreductase [Bacteroidota bacterium]